MFQISKTNTKGDLFSELLTELKFTANTVKAAPMDALPKSFKDRRSFGQRVREVETVRRDHPSKVPVIIERYRHENQLPPLDRSKFLVPEHVSVGEIINILRRRLQLNSSQSIFLIVNGRNLPANTASFSEVYRNEKDDDGFLYIVYASHETFGGTLEKSKNHCQELP